MTYSCRPYRVILEESGLWEEFNANKNEMIITKAGRCLFPIYRIHLEPLQSHIMTHMSDQQASSNKINDARSPIIYINLDRYYQISMEMMQVDDKKWRFRHGKWHALTINARMGSKRDSSITSEKHEFKENQRKVTVFASILGRDIIHHGLSFESVKVTNQLYRGLTNDNALSSDIQIATNSVRLKPQNSNEEEALVPYTHQVVLPEKIYMSQMKLGGYGNFKSKQYPKNNENSLFLINSPTKLILRSKPKRSKRPHYLTLRSFHRYMPIIKIKEIASSNSDEFNVSSDDGRQIVQFPQTQFIAVTHYQNEKVTMLKKSYNPHAKGYAPASTEVSSKLSINEQKNLEWRRDSVSVEDDSNVDMQSEESDLSVPHSIGGHSLESSEDEYLIEAGSILQQISQS